MVPDCLPRRVLLIDDDPMLRRTLGALLRHAGHAVAEAADGRAGVAIFRETPVDIVLTDFAMPGFTGWEVAQAAKAINPRVPVVYVTGCVQAIAPHQTALADAIIEKPCGLAALQAVIGPLTMQHQDPDFLDPPPVASSGAAFPDPLASV
jgi:CheY-like chemotaxis protein